MPSFINPETLSVTEYLCFLLLYIFLYLSYVVCIVGVVLDVYYNDRHPTFLDILIILISPVFLIWYIVRMIRRSVRKS